MRFLSLTNPIKPLSEVVVITLSLGLLATGSAEAASFTFSKIADTSTVIPGSNNLTFSYLYSDPRIDNGIVVFTGEARAANQQLLLRGLYTSSEGILKTVVDTRTLVPYNDVNFIDAGYLGLSIDQGNIIFYGRGNKPNDLGGTDAYGIYTVIGGVLERVIDQSTILPGDNSNFRAFYQDSLAINDTNVAFKVGLNFDNAAIFSNVGGTLQKVVDQSTPLPEGGGNFQNIGFPSISKDVIAFTNTTYINGDFFKPYAALYTYRQGVLERIVDSASLMIDDKRWMIFEENSKIDGNDLAFSVYGSGEEQAIYTIVGQTINRVVDTNTSVPGGNGNFSRLNGFSFDNGNIAFLGKEILGYVEEPPSEDCPYCPPLNYPLEREGIYTNLGGSLAKVITDDDQLDGKTIAYLGMSRQMLSGNSLVFNANFTDGSSGIYRADFVPNPPKSVPEPASVLGLLPTVGALLLRRRKERKEAFIKGTQHCHF